MKRAETILAIKGTKMIVCPAAPAPCSYVRVLNNGVEEAYWDSDEWREDPEGVMGAILGAIRSLREQGG